jgi:hypothetical protein
MLCRAGNLLQVSALGCDAEPAAVAPCGRHHAGEQPRGGQVPHLLAPEWRAARRLAIRQVT